MSAYHLRRASASGSWLGTPFRAEFIAQPAPHPPCCELANLTARQRNVS
jgi:hypothetical protein